MVDLDDHIQFVHGDSFNYCIMVMVLSIIMILVLILFMSVCMCVVCRFFTMSEFISLIFLLILGVLDVEIEFCAIGGEINSA